jgi:hypothetical protein
MKNTKNLLKASLVLVTALFVSTQISAMEKKGRRTDRPYTKQLPRETTDVPKVRVSNNSKERIHLLIEEVDCSTDYTTTPLPNGKRTLRPGEKFVMDYTGRDCLRVKVNDGSAANRIDWLARIQNGEVVDVIYGDNGTYFPWLFGKGGWDTRYRSKRSAPHLYEVRDGKTLNHGHDEL